MITATVSVAEIAFSDRLDTAYHLNSRVMASRRIARAAEHGAVTRRLGGPGGLAEVRQPARFKRVYAGAAEQAVPYLRPYDVFDFLPVPADQLSPRDGNRISDLMLATGMLVLPASGRNLGPAVAIDGYLSRFALSHDAIRIIPRDPDDRPYLLAFINCPTGQSLIRQSMTGSVIDHVSATDIAAIPVPILPERAAGTIRSLMAASIATRERSRLLLDSLKRQAAASLPPLSRHRPATGWTAPPGSAGDRLDAAACSPAVAEALAILRAEGGIRLDSVATVTKPASRYKAYHVDQTHGHPFLAGGQLGQSTVIAPKFMADRVFKDPERYRLRAGQVAFGADGRAEEGLGIPAMVTPDRHGWLASEHVMRLTPRPGVHAGWLYLALCLPHVQLQIRALARGSVVDTLYEDDIAGVILPPVDALSGQSAGAAWEDFATARSLEQRATALFEAVLDDDPGATYDTLITIREAAAVRAVSAPEIISLIEQGILTPLGGLDSGNALLSLDDVREAEMPHSSEDHPPQAAQGHPSAVAYGYVTSVGPDTFEAMVSDEPEDLGQPLRLPLRALDPASAERGLMPGDRFTWTIRPVSQGSPGTPPLDRSVIKLLPRAILTADEVNESYLWADAFLRDHFRMKTNSDDYPG